MSIAGKRIQVGQHPTSRRLRDLDGNTGHPVGDYPNDERLKALEDDNDLSGRGSGSFAVQRRLAAVEVATAVPPFSPGDLDGLALWFKADAIDAADGDPLASWPDSSGNGFDAVQATGSKKPLYRTPDGLPGVHFDGADDWLVIQGDAPSEDTADGLLQGDVTMFAVIKSETQPAVDGYAPIVMGTDGPGLYWGAFDPGHSDVEYFASAHALLFGSYLIANGSGADGVTYVITIEDSAATGTIRRDGADVTDPLYQGTNPTNWTPAWISSDDGDHNFTGFVHEILIYDGALSNDDRLSVEVHLTAKWLP